MAEKSRNWVAVLNTLHQSDRLNRVSEGAELLYRRLLEVVDNGGNYFADPSLLLGYIFAHRMSSGLTPKDMMDRTQELVRVGLLDVYADGKLLHISRYYTRLRSDGHGADIRFAAFVAGNSHRPDSDRTPPGVHPASTESEIEIDSEREESEKRRKKSAPTSSDAPASESSTTSPDSRTFAQQCVDRALVSYEKRYCLTRQLTAYPGGPKALAKGYGVVVETLAGFCTDFPKTKAQTATKTEKELNHVASVVQIAWVGYLDRAAAIDEAAHKIPGKDGTWLRFPSTPVMFCKRIPQLSESDVDAAGKRVADVAEAKRNSKRMNPESTPTVRYGEFKRAY